MEIYPIPMVPGPVRVPPEVTEAYRKNYGSADLEPEFFDLYERTAAMLQQVLGTGQTVVIQTGEGMLALWGALKSCLAPGDRVLSVATGVFGYGIGDMARTVGAEVKTVGIPYDETLSDLSPIEEAIREFQPGMITAVHCETPSGTLNPLQELGRLKSRYQVPLLYVDAVASAGGTPVLADEWQIDLCLGGSQKCLSAPPDMTFLSVSEAAWDVIDRVDYAGYDALKPFREAVGKRFFPYTPSWHGVAALEAACGLLLKEGLEQGFRRHEAVAGYCREKLLEMGLELFPAPGAVSSPTVTAVAVPEHIGWAALDAGLRREGMVVGGSYGPLAEKVFRLGHMGSQADMDLMKRALAAVAKVLDRRIDL